MRLLQPPSGGIPEGLRGGRLADAVEEQLGDVARGVVDHGRVSVETWRRGLYIATGGGRATAWASLPRGAGGQVGLTRRLSVK